MLRQWRARKRWEWPLYCFSRWLALLQRLVIRLRNHPRGFHDRYDGFVVTVPLLLQFQMKVVHHLRRWGIQLSLTNQSKKRASSISTEGLRSWKEHSRRVRLAIRVSPSVIGKAWKGKDHSTGDRKPLGLREHCWLLLGSCESRFYQCHKRPPSPLACDQSGVIVFFRVNVNDRGLSISHESPQLWRDFPVPNMQLFDTRGQFCRPTSTRGNLSTISKMNTLLSQNRGIRKEPLSPPMSTI